MAAASATQRFDLDYGRGVTRLTVTREREHLADELAGWGAGAAVFVVTSKPVWELHGATCLGRLSEAAGRFEVLEVADGEAAKTVDTAERLWRSMIASEGKRDSRLVTFGGGTVGDVGGFVAGTFMRGIELVHVPTTLLAQVDAAIGGKAAINLTDETGAKNSVGVFHHPSRVVTATDVLETLPPRQLAAGLVEVIKAAALLDPTFFASLETSLPTLPREGAAGETGGSWVELVATAQRLKAGVVHRDPEERGERRVLNFGHTLGHALEASLGYGELLHGEAVAWGMRFATSLAAARGLDEGVRRRIDGLLDRLGGPPLPPRRPAELLRYVERDKKARREGPVWVLPTSLGAWEAVRLPRDVVARALTVFVEEHAAC